MIKLYREIVERMLLCVQYAKAKGVSPRQLWNYRQDEWANSEIRNRDGDLPPDPIYSSTSYNGMGSEETWDALVSQVTAQLKSDSSTSGDASLVDTVIDLLQAPYGRNVVSGKTLVALRKALLLPEELAVFQAMARQREHNCGGCAKPLGNGEMVTIYRGGNDTHVRCVRCMVPVMTGCPQCSGYVPLGTKIGNYIKKRATCGGCLPDTPEDGGVYVPGDIPPPPPTIHPAPAPTLRTITRIWEEELGRPLAGPEQPRRHTVIPTRLPRNQRATNLTFRDFIAAQDNLQAATGAQTTAAPAAPANQPLHPLVEDE